MSKNDQEKMRTNLLADASVQHLRLTLEEIPVGTIAVTDQGIIESIDEWTEHELEFSAAAVRGSSINMLFADKADQLVQLMQEKSYGLAGEFALYTQAGDSIPAQIAVVPSGNSHRHGFSLIYTQL